MGTTKMSRKGPGWQDMNTNRGPEKYSTGYKVPYEGTLISGENPQRRNVRAGTRDKSTESSGKKY